MHMIIQIVDVYGLDPHWHFGGDNGSGSNRGYSYHPRFYTRWSALLLIHRMRGRQLAINVISGTNYPPGVTWTLTGSVTADCCFPTT